MAIFKKKKEVEEKEVKETKKTPCAKKVDSKTAKKVETKTADKKSKEEKVIAKPKENKAVYHIMFNAETKVWSIKKDKAKRIIASFKTKDEAVARAKKIGDSNEITIMIYKKDGKVQTLINL